MTALRASLLGFFGEGGEGRQKSAGTSQEKKCKLAPHVGRRTSALPLDCSPAEAELMKLAASLSTRVPVACIDPPPVANPAASYRSLSGPLGPKSPINLKKKVCQGRSPGSQKVWKKSRKSLEKSGKSLENICSGLFPDFFRLFGISGPEGRETPVAHGRARKPPVSGVQPTASKCRILARSIPASAWRCCTPDKAHNMLKMSLDVGSGRSSVGKCTGAKWSKRPFWSK